MEELTSGPELDLAELKREEAEILSQIEMERIVSRSVDFEKEPLRRPEDVTPFTHLQARLAQLQMQIAELEEPPSD